MDGTDLEFAWWAGIGISSVELSGSVTIVLVSLVKIIVSRIRNVLLVIKH